MISGTGKLALAATLGALSISSPVQAADVVAPPSGQVTLDVQTVNGSGCPSGTASVAMSADNTAFKITYSEYLAEAGGTADTTDWRKNCQVNLVVNVPAGFSFAVAQADYYGRLHLESGATALERANYYFAGSSDNSYVDHTFTGAADGAWHTTDSTAAADLVWSACGASKSLNINTELRVTAGTSSKRSYISMRASDGDVYTLVNFQWQQC